MLNMLKIAVMDTELNQLYWQCRRGMWELDLYLIPFLRNCYLTLAATEQQRFREFLELPDPELYTFLNGQKLPQTEFQTIVTLIRDHAKHSDKMSVF